MKEDKFEDKLNKLELLNKRIKSGELPLDETVSCFEEGMKLAEILEKEINEIERKVEILINGQETPIESNPEFKDYQE